MYEDVISTIRVLYTKIKMFKKNIALCVKFEKDTEIINHENLSDINSRFISFVDIDMLSEIKKTHRNSTPVLKASKKKKEKCQFNSDVNYDIFKKKKEHFNNNNNNNNNNCMDDNNNKSMNVNKNSRIDDNNKNSFMDDNK